MANTIKVLRGLETNRLSITPEEGEILYTTDEKLLYIGDGSTVGGNLVNISGIEFDKIKFNTTLSNPTWEEGTMFYDKDKNAVSYYNEQSDIVVNLGQELLLKVENQTGSTITNGTVIAPDATTIITLADAHIKKKSSVIAVMTHDIAHGATGYATKLGQVGGLDTSAFTPGQILHLGEGVNAGKFVAESPVDGGFHCTVGVVDVVHATEGIITVDINTSELTVEVTDTNGFPIDQKEGTTISVVEATRTFTIAPTGTQFHYYETGDKYEQIGSDSIVFDDLEGEHWIYYNEGVLSKLYQPTLSERQHIILNNAFICGIYWNATDNKVEIDIQDERHGIGMSPQTHLYLHLTRGAQWISGYGLSDILADENGSSDSHAQFSVGTGKYFDEDIVHELVSEITSTTGLDVAYLSGAGPVLRSDLQTGFSVLNAPAGRLYYNQEAGGTWGLTEVTNGNYVLCHIFGFNGVTTKAIAVMGQNEYANASSARSGATTEISSIFSMFDVPELIPVGTVIFQTRDNYSNSVKARIITTEDGHDYIDWRTSDLAQGAAPSSHANLTNVEMAGSGVIQGHINNDPQSLYGIKTFIVSPECSEVPTTGDQLTNKTYVDANSDKYTSFGVQENSGTASDILSGYNVNFKNGTNIEAVGAMGADTYGIQFNFTGDENATHTGQVTGATALALDVSAITAQPETTNHLGISGSDHFLFNNSGTLEKLLLSTYTSYLVNTLPFSNNDGDVVGPASATNAGIALYNGTTGKIISESSFGENDLTNWDDFYNTPADIITAGTNLSWSGNTLNATAGSAGNLTGDVTSVGLATTLSATAITGKSIMGTITPSQDYLLISDSGVLKRLQYDDIISGMGVSMTAVPSSTDEFLISDGGTLKKMDYQFMGSANATASQLSKRDASADLYAHDFVTSSDRRLKKNIKPLSNNELDVEYVEFEMIDDETERRRVGVIAQDLQKVRPEYVKESEDGTLSVSYTELHTEEIFKLKKENEELKARLARLEEKWL